jgi:hypothetical protein
MSSSMEPVTRAVMSRGEDWEKPPGSDIESRSDHSDLRAPELASCRIAFSRAVREGEICRAAMAGLPFLSLPGTWMVGVNPGSSTNRAERLFGPRACSSK